jgi:hypothetical protein
MNIDLYTKSASHVASTDFTVSIDGIDVSFEIDEVSGLSSGTINYFEHRSSGSTSRYKEHYAGLVTLSDVTFTGLYLYNLEDVKKLLDWHDACSGRALEVDTKRTVLVTPTFRGWDGEIIEGDTVPGQYVLSKCSCVGIDVSTFSTDSADPSTWTLTIKPTSFNVVVGG